MGAEYVCRLGDAVRCAGDSERGAQDAELASWGRGQGAIAEIIEARPSRGEPSIACTAYIALAKGDRLDYAVQKSVELGAHGVVLFPSRRCVSIPGDMAKKVARLQRIALETAKQCGRGRVPTVSAMGSFEAAIKEASSAELPLFFYECEERLSLREALEQWTLGSFSIVTGPEGGFEPHEAEHARDAGMLAVTLGPRILRCETAPAAALAAIMFHTGNL